MSTDTLPAADPRVSIESFGYLHAPPPPAHLVVDVRDLLRNPHGDLSVRELDGVHPTVRDHVLATPGATVILRSLHLTVETLVAVKTFDSNPVRVALGCAGGRHRSVALAGQLAGMLRSAGIRTDVVHRDVHRPVVDSGTELTMVRAELADAHETLRREREDHTAQVRHLRHAIRVAEARLALPPAAMAEGTATMGALCDKVTPVPETAVPVGPAPDEKGAWWLDVPPGASCPLCGHERGDHSGLDGDSCEKGMSVGHPCGCVGPYMAQRGLTGRAATMAETHAADLHQGHRVDGCPLCEQRAKLDTSS